MCKISSLPTQGGNKADFIMGEMVQISKGEAGVVRKFEAKDIPKEYYNRFTQNQTLGNIHPVFTLLTPLSIKNEMSADLVLICGNLASQNSFSDEPSGKYESKIAVVLSSKIQKH